MSTLTHGQIWSALDSLAARAGLSPSALARRAGLDPTTFNKSKRLTSDGRQRWPSTESISKVLTATGASMDTFVQLMETTNTVQMVPALAFADAGSAGHFDRSGHPTGMGWGRAKLPAIGDQNVYALEISGDTLKPLYRDGDILIVSPDAPIRRGDRVVVKMQDGLVTIRELRRRTQKFIELQSLAPDNRDIMFNADDVTWMARIIWASQ
jgi:phage repressor protein C with HTH and peptisase S24 domain